MYSSLLCPHQAHLTMVQKLEETTDELMYSKNALTVEKARSDALLHSILPRTVAKQILNRQEVRHRWQLIFSRCYLAGLVVKIRGIAYGLSHSFLVAIFSRQMCSCGILTAVSECHLSALSIIWNGL